jgi:hypothetical protein
MDPHHAFEAVESHLDVRNLGLMKAGQQYPVCEKLFGMPRHSLGADSRGWSGLPANRLAQPLETNSLLGGVAAVEPRTANQSGSVRSRASVRPGDWCTTTTAPR